MAGVGTGVGWKFRGYITPNKNGNKGYASKKNEEEEEDVRKDAFDSQEMEAMLEDAVNIPTKKLKKETVCIRGLDDKKKKIFDVEGEFIFTQPWWEVTVEALKITHRQKCLEMTNKPKYRVRTDNRLDVNEGNGSVMASFLAACMPKDKDEKKRRKFLQYLRTQAQMRGENVDFTLLQNVIKTCNEIKEKKKKKLCKSVRKKLLMSAHYRTVITALPYPELMDGLSVLLPKSLPSLLEKCSLNKMSKLDYIMKNRPFIFGFSYKLHEETGLLLPEVTYEAFSDSGLLKDMTHKTQRALLTYGELKGKISKYGDTFSWLQFKPSSKGSSRQRNRSGQDVCEDAQEDGKKKKSIVWLKEFIEDKHGFKFESREFREVIGFLKDSMGVIKVEPDRNRVFLRRYYEAEKNVAGRIMEIMNTKQNSRKCGHCEYCSVKKVDRSVSGREQKDDGVDEEGVVVISQSAIEEPVAQEEDDIVTKEGGDILAQEDEDIVMSEDLEVGPSSKQNTIRSCLSLDWNDGDDDDFEEPPKKKPSKFGKNRRNKLSRSKGTSKSKPSVSTDRIDDDFEEFQKKKPSKVKKSRRTKLSRSKGASNAKPSTSTTNSASRVAVNEPESKMTVKSPSINTSILHQQSTGKTTLSKSKVPSKKNEACDDADDDVTTSDNAKSAQEIEEELQKRQAERDRQNFKDDVDQHAAAKSIRENPFSLIIGRGGCGKTHVVCEVMKEYCGASIVMAAPTGKAASNLRKKFAGDKQLRSQKVKAKTLHQVLYTHGFAKRKGLRWEFRDTEILVIDECSMVEVELLSNVLKVLMEKAKLKKVIMMGDYRQLPAVKPGKLLQDLYDHFKDEACCVELKTNHRAESQHIVDCAIKISNQEMPEWNSQEFCVIDPPKQTASFAMKRKFIQKVVDGEPKLRDHQTSQFVAFKNDDCRDLNELCCEIYANHAQKTQYGYLSFEKGDKICPTQNTDVTDVIEKELYDAEKCQLKRGMQKSYVKKGGWKDSDDSSEDEGHHGDLVDDDDEEEEEEEEEEKPSYKKRICNGEIYFMKKIEVPKNGEDAHVTIKDGIDGIDGIDELVVPMSELRNLAAINHAWARTIHTYQGSESDVVVYWLGKSAYQSWQHVYTAVTRGKNKVIIVGKQKTLREAIKRKPQRRQTVLKYRLEDAANRLYLRKKQQELQKRSLEKGFVGAKPSASVEDHKKGSVRLSDSNVVVASKDKWKQHNRRFLTPRKHHPYQSPSKLPSRSGQTYEEGKKGSVSTGVLNSKIKGDWETKCVAVEVESKDKWSPSSVRFLTPRKRRPHESPSKLPSGSGPIVSSPGLLSQLKVRKVGINDDASKQSPFTGLKQQEKASKTSAPHNIAHIKGTSTAISPNGKMYTFKPNKLPEHVKSPKANKISIKLASPSGESKSGNEDHENKGPDAAAMVFDKGIVLVGHHIIEHSSKESSPNHVKYVEEDVHQIYPVLDKLTTDKGVIDSSETTIGTNIPTLERDGTTVKSNDPIISTRYSMTTTDSSETFPVIGGTTMNSEGFIMTTRYAIDTTEHISSKTSASMGSTSNEHVSNDASAIEGPAIATNCGNPALAANGAVINQGCQEIPTTSNGIANQFETASKKGAAIDQTSNENMFTIDGAAPQSEIPSNLDAEMKDDWSQGFLDFAVKIEADATINQSCKENVIASNEVNDPSNSAINGPLITMKHDPSLEANSTDINKKSDEDVKGSNAAANQSETEIPGSDGVAINHGSDENITTRNGAATQTEVLSNLDADVDEMSQEWSQGFLDLAVQMEADATINQGLEENVRASNDQTSAINGPTTAAKHDDPALEAYGAVINQRSNGNVVASNGVATQSEIESNLDASKANGVAINQRSDENVKQANGAATQCEKPSSIDAEMDDEWSQEFLDLAVEMEADLCKEYSTPDNIKNRCAEGETPHTTEVTSHNDITSTSGTNNATSDSSLKQHKKSPTAVLKSDPPANLESNNAKPIYANNVKDTATVRSNKPDALHEASEESQQMSEDCNWLPEFFATEGETITNYNNATQKQEANDSTTRTGQIDYRHVEAENIYPSTSGYKSQINEHRNNEMSSALRDTGNILAGCTDHQKKSSALLSQGNLNSRKRLYSSPNNDDFTPIKRKL